MSIYTTKALDRAIWAYPKCQANLLLRRSSVINRSNYAGRVIKERNQFWLSANSQETNRANETFTKKVGNIWNGPNFKYWFFGVTGFTVWLSYYSLKAYKQTRIDILLLPSLPPHNLVGRNNEVEHCRQLISKEPRIGGKLKLISLAGPSGVGKSILAYFFGQRMLADLEWTKLSLPKSKVMVSLKCDSEISLVLSLQAVAAKLQIKPSELRKMADIETELALLPKNEQCDALLKSIQDKLSKHPDWVMLFDNLDATTPREVVHMIKKWFLNTEMAKEWSRGIVILTCDGPILEDMPDVKQMPVSGRMSEINAVELLSQTSGIEEHSLRDLGATKRLLSQIYYHPLAIICVGELLKAKLAEDQVASISHQLKTLCEEIEKNVTSVKSASSKLGPFANSEGGGSLIAVETAVAMVTRHLLDSDPYLLHSFDLIATCAPRQPIPLSLVSRHLRTCFFNLPPLVTDSSAGIQEMFKKDSRPTAEGEDKEDDTLTPKGKAWSNKRLAEYLRKIEDWFSNVYGAFKELYDLYYNIANFESKEEDGLDMIRKCPLLQCTKLEPGGVESVTMHPLVYAVARQNFISSTVPKLEKEFLLEDKQKYERQPWYRKMSTYDATTSLVKFRNTLSEIVLEPERATQLIELYNNAMIDVSSTLQAKEAKSEDASGQELFAVDCTKHLHSHLQRTLASVSDELNIAKQNIAGKTMSKHVGLHVEYILNSHSLDLLGVKNRSSGLLSLSSVCSNIYNDPQSALVLLNAALQLQQESPEMDNLDVASTLTQLGNVYKSIDDTESSKMYLEQAFDIYERHRKKVGEYKRPLEFGKTLAALGIVCSAVGERHRSKELLERSLMFQQAGAPDLSDEAKSKHFGAEFASSLTDLGHAYLSEGMPLYGKKILDLALVAHKNISGESHPEVMRTLNLLSIAHLMQGHNEESKRLRIEAGKVKAAINIQPLY